MRRKTLCVLAAAAGSVGLGNLTKTQASAIVLNITASAGVWTVYALDSTGNAGIADLQFDVVGTGGLSVTNDTSLNTPTGSDTIVVKKTSTTYSTGFVNPTTNTTGTNGVGITASQGGVAYGGQGAPNNATSDSFVYQGYGQTSGSSAYGGSWTQTALGVDVASGTYLGSAGTLTVSMEGPANFPNDGVLANVANGGTGAWEGPENLTTNVPATPGTVIVASVAGHPIISLTTTTPTNAGNYGNQILNGTGTQNGTYSTGTNKLTVSGSNGTYLFAQVTGISSGSGTATGYVEANGFSPATDEEIYGLDVDLSKGTLAGLASDINGSNVSGLVADQMIAFTSIANDPFPGNYNLFLEYPSGDLPLGTTGDNFLGVDLTQDANNTGTVLAIAVVPEPMSLGMLALGGIGMLARRRRSSKA